MVYAEEQKAKLVEGKVAGAARVSEPLPATGADRLAALHAAGLSVADLDGHLDRQGAVEEMTGVERE